jgi:hypothetical protein
MAKPISDKRAVQGGECYSENLDDKLARGKQRMMSNVTVYPRQCYPCIIGDQISCENSATVKPCEHKDCSQDSGNNGAN